MTNTRNEKTPVVALVGRPNVGKSTLFNRLARQRKAIVDSTPGVTRDRHYETIVWDEQRILLIDTGGIELKSDEERMSGLVREQTLQAVEEADIVVFILDGREGMTAEDYHILELLRKGGKPLWCVVNKLDGPKDEEIRLAQFYELGLEKLWPLSAEHGYGVSTFMDDLVSGLPTLAATDPGLPEETIRIACVGRPNVGKSSLINCLAGKNRMLVSEIPGTTRDSVDTLISHNDRNYLLIDTAGIRRKGKVRDKLEKFSIIKALSAMEHSDLALILLDAEEGLTEQDTKIIGYGLERGLACMILFNKWDLVRDNPKQQRHLIDELERNTRFIEYAPYLPISARTRLGINKIFPTLTTMYSQYCQEFGTGFLNRLLRKAVEGHSPPLYQGKRIRLYYTTQVGTRPPTFAIFANYPDGIHFSYHRYLVNTFRKGLGLTSSPIKLVIRERTRLTINKK